MDASGNYLTHFMAMASFYKPFQGIQNKASGMKWVKRKLTCLLMFLKKILIQN